MAGSPTWGKISTGIRSTASSAHRAMAIRAMTTVTGRLRAANTRRMVHLFGQSLTGLGEEGLKIAAGRRDFEQRAPDVQAGQSVVDLSLHEQPLSLRHVIDRRQPRLVPHRGLLQGRAGRGNLDPDRRQVEV